MSRAPSGDRLDVHLICGGRWHDFDFARLQLLGMLAEHDHVRTSVADDYGALASHRPDVLITYCCDVRPSVAQQLTVSEFVDDGGTWIALHGTMAVLARTAQGMAAPRVLEALVPVLGAQFIAHPPIAPHYVDIVDPTHPLVAGMAGFEVTDELYLLKQTDPARNHVILSTRWRGGAVRGFCDTDWDDADWQPVLYERRVGNGLVVALTLGHCRGHYDMQPEIEFYDNVERGAWTSPEFTTIVQRAIQRAVTRPT